MATSTEHDVVFSIVIPTYQRRDVLVRTMASLAGLRAPWPVEVVVVVDGSTDGSADAARAVPLPFPLTVVEQANGGAAKARNRGAAQARGRHILFLDDDMEVDPGLLVALEEVFARGADAVVGHLPVHPDAPPTLLTRGLERWARLRHERLARTSGQLTLADLITAQLSVRASSYREVGGFDEAFTAGGEWGGEDTDFLHRLLETGAAVRYAPEAVSYQRYVVTPDHYLRQWRQAGRADAVLVRKHPVLVDELVQQHGGTTPVGRVLRRWAPAVPGPVGRALVAPVLARARAGGADPLTRWLFARARDAQYWRGAAERGGLTRPGPVVLAYHAVEEVDDALIGDWCVPPEALAAQLDALAAAGFTWIGVEQLLASLDGAPLPARAALVTFDDAYASVLDSAAPVIGQRGIRPVVLPVSAHVGGWNEWDAVRGATKLPLLDAAGLAELARRGWSIGAHSRSHAHLVRSSAAELRAELDGALADLRALGLPVVPVLAHPHGEHDARVRAAARRAGYRAAFALAGDGTSRYALPRIEVRRGTTPEALVAAALAGPRRPSGEVRRELRGAARAVLRALHRPSA